MRVSHAQCVRVESSVLVAKAGTDESRMERNQSGRAKLKII